MLRVIPDITDTDKDTITNDINEITLEGFSRGAVKTFAVAKKLDNIGIPMHIIANQPVPGEVALTQRIFAI